MSGRMARICLAALCLCMVAGCGRKGEIDRDEIAIESLTGGPKAYPVMIVLPCNLGIEVSGDRLVLAITPQKNVDLADYTVNVNLNGPFLWEHARPLAEASQPVRAGRTVEVVLPYDSKMAQGMLQIFRKEK